MPTVRRYLRAFVNHGIHVNANFAPLFDGDHVETTLPPGRRCVMTLDAFIREKHKLLGLRSSDGRRTSHRPNV